MTGIDVSRMSRSVAEREKNPAARAGFEKAAFIVAKFAVTAACFWYLSRQIDLAQVFAAIPGLNFRWAGLALAIGFIQIPLVGLRWYEIVSVLVAVHERITRAAIIAITSIGVFFAQVLPSVIGDGIRTWFLVRLGCDWRNAVKSVILDRAMGAGVMIALTFLILLLPSALGELGGYRNIVLVIYGTFLACGGLGLLFFPVLFPLLQRARYLRWIVALAADARALVLGRASPIILGLAILVHSLTIVTIWLLARAQGMAVPATDAAVLFAVIVGVALIPISIGGWGLRELAVVSVLARHGVAPEQALLFSVSFGLMQVISSLPGGLVWALYVVRPQRAARVAEQAASAKGHA
jgi:glycosyltransferase 2 family protein